MANMHHRAKFRADRASHIGDKTVSQFFKDGGHQQSWIYCTPVYLTSFLPFFLLYLLLSLCFDLSVYFFQNRPIFSRLEVVGSDQTHLSTQGGLGGSQEHFLNQ